MKNNDVYEEEEEEDEKEKEFYLNAKICLIKSFSVSWALL